MDKSKNSNMTHGERFHIGTAGQFGDPTDEDLKPYAAKFLESLGATAVKPEDLLKENDLREQMINEFLGDQEAAAIKAEADEKAKVVAEAAEKAAKSKAETDRVRQAFYAMKGIGPEEQKRLMTVAWAKAMAEALASNCKVVDPPVARKHGEDDTCGAPDSIGCCDHTGKVSDWSLLPNGEPPYGICGTLKSVYDELYELSGKKVRIFLHSASKVGQEAKATYRKEKEVPVSAFVTKFVTEHKNHLQFTPEPKRGEDGKLVCSMGGKLVPCCDGNQPAERFPHWEGKVYGWCKNFAGAAWANFLRIKNMKEAAEDMTSDDKYNEAKARIPRYGYRLRSDKTEEQAGKSAAGFLASRDVKNNLNAKLDELASGYARWSTEVPSPEPHGEKDGYGNIVLHKCAAGKAGWGCCDGNNEAERGSHHEGVVRGFCRLSQQSLFRVWKAMKDANQNGGNIEQAPDHIRTAEIDQAMNWAEQYNNNRTSRPNWDSKSPLGNVTDPAKSARHDRNVKNRSEHDRANARGGKGKGKGGGKKGNRGDE